MYSNQKNNLAIVRSRENYCEKLVKELLKDKIDFTDSTRDYVLQRDIYLKKNETLPINAAVYIANNRKIYCYHTNQIVFGNKGKLLNGCNNNYNAIAIRTKRKKKFLLF
mgnify:CR=1 FL=1